MLPVTFQCTECGALVSGRAGLGLCGACALRGAMALEEAEIGAEAAAEGRGMAAPRRFGDYDLLGELARGGMGVVYRARQRSLDRVVALKVLLGGVFAGEEGKRRLQAEAAAAARLRHPNIVAVHDAGMVDGQPFFSMTLVEGTTLAEAARSGPLAPENAARCVAQVAEAVHYAHTQGVLHRDLKPSNVLLDARGEPHVTDFGLAKSFADTEGNGQAVRGGAGGERGAPAPVSAQALTLTGQVLGSPAYMAPEQATGRSRELGPASDVYSLGAILYELLAGRPPFVGATPHTVIEQVKTVDPIPLRRLKPGVPVDLETICLKALEKEPGRRYGTARELAEELGRFLRGEPVRARPVGAAGQAWRWMRRHRALSVVLSLLGLLLVGGTVGATLAALRIKRAERAAVASLREALLEQARGRRLTGGLGTRTETLESVRRATELGLDEDQRVRARTEAIGALAMDEVRFVPQPQLPRASLARSALDPTFRWFAVVETNNVVILYQVSDGREMARLVDATAHRAINGQPEFSADGHHLAIIYRDRLNIWSVTNGQLCFTSPGVTNVFAFSGDGQSFALAGADGTVTLRELPSGRLQHQLAAGAVSPSTPTANARRMGVSSDGRRLAVVQAVPNCVDLFDFRTGARLFRLAAGAGAKNVSWSRDDAYLAISGQTGVIEIWETATGSLRDSYPAGNTAFRCLEFHPTEPWLAAVSPRRHVDLRDRLTGRLVADAPADADQVVFSSDGSRLGPVWLGGQAGWLETRLAPVYRAVSVGSPQTPSWQASFNPDGGALVLCSSDRLTVLNPVTLTPFAAMTNRAPYFGSFDGAGFLWTIDRAGVHRWNPGLDASFKWVWHKLETRWSGSEWRWLAFSADGRWVGAANRQLGQLMVAPLAAADSGAVSPRPVGSHPGVRWAALDRGARLGVTGSLTDKRLKVWDLAEKRLLLELPAGGDAGRAAFSPDGRWLATFGEEGLLWSVGNWTKPVATLFSSGETGLGGGVFSADGRWLAVVANLREIHLFDAHEARRVAVFPSPEPLGIQALALSPDGRWLMALGQEGWLQRWDLSALDQALAPLGLELRRRP